MNLRKIRRQIHYHSKQRFGITIVLIIIFALIGLSQYSAWKHVSSSYNIEEHREILTKLHSKAKKRDKKRIKPYESKSSLRPYKFDPNTVSASELIEMGVKKSIAKSWTKYTAKGGTFRDVKDLKKLYVMSDILYEKISPFVDIKKNQKYRKTEYKKMSNWENKEDNKNKSIEYKKIEKDTLNSAELKKYNTVFNNTRRDKGSGLAEDYIISLNTTDSIELQILDGIGPVLSSRIIRYRDKLGGFHNMNQLLEIYGVKTSLISKIINKINFEGTLHKIELNQITLDSLVKHPYFDYATANIFINYRKHHGPYRGIEDVKKIIAIKQYWLDEVSPYFSYTVSQ